MHIPRQVDVGWSLPKPLPAAATSVVPLKVHHLHSHPVFFAVCSANSDCLPFEFCGNGQGYIMSVRRQSRVMQGEKTNIGNVDLGSLLSIRSREKTPAEVLLPMVTRRSATAASDSRIKVETPKRLKTGAAVASARETVSPSRGRIQALTPTLGTPGRIVSQPEKNLSPSQVEAHSRAVEKLRKEFIERNTLHFTKLREAFRTIDKDHNGTVLITRRLSFFETHFSTGTLDQDELYQAMQFMGCLDVNYDTVGNLMRAGIDQARKERPNNTYSDEGIDVDAFARFLWPGVDTGQLIDTSDVHERSKLGGNKLKKFLWTGKVGSYSDMIADGMRQPKDFEVGRFHDVNASGVPWDVVTIGAPIGRNQSQANQIPILVTERTEARHQKVLNAKFRFSKHMLEQSFKRSSVEHNIINCLATEHSEHPAIPSLMVTFSKIEKGQHTSGRNTPSHFIW